LHTECKIKMVILANCNTFVSVVKGKVTPLQARLWPIGGGEEV
jgi:hypothetical protein